MRKLILLTPLLLMLFCVFALPAHAQSMKSVQQQNTCSQEDCNGQDFFSSGCSQFGIPGYWLHASADIKDQKGKILGAIRLTGSDEGCGIAVAFTNNTSVEDSANNGDLFSNFHSLFFSPKPNTYDMYTDILGGEPIVYETSAVAKNVQEVASPMIGYSSNTICATGHIYENGQAYSNTVCIN